jgi:hypothetical protein
MAAVEHSIPTTLAPSRTIRSSGSSRSICFSMSCRMLSGIPDSLSPAPLRNCQPSAESAMIPSSAR